MGRNSNWLFVLVFGVIGLSLLLGAYFLARDQIEFRRGAATTPGTVINLETAQDEKGRTYYRPVFTYRDRTGRTHRATDDLGYPPPELRVGQAVVVRYRPENPGDARLDGFIEIWIASLVVGGLGLVFTSIGAGFLTYELRKLRLRAWLVTHGAHAEAQVEQVYRDTTLSVNGQSPWRISAQWQDPVTRKVFVFKSDYIWFDPTPYVQRETVDVRINADNPRQYDMDLSFLPKSG